MPEKGEGSTIWLDNELKAELDKVRRSIRAPATLSYGELIALLVSIGKREGWK